MSQARKNQAGRNPNGKAVHMTNSSSTRSEPFWTAVMAAEDRTGRDIARFGTVSQGQPSMRKASLSANQAQAAVNSFIREPNDETFDRFFELKGKAQLDESTYWKAVVELWRSDRAGKLSYDQWDVLWFIGAPLTVMTDSERAAYARLPSQVTVYRGFVWPIERPYGWLTADARWAVRRAMEEGTFGSSWTPDPRQAYRHAQCAVGRIDGHDVYVHSPAQGRLSPCVAEGFIDKQWVIACFDRGSGYEIVALSDSVTYRNVLETAEPMTPQRRLELLRGRAAAERNDHARS